MTGEERLAKVFLEKYPEVAARLLESMDAEQAGEVLQSAPAGIAAPVLRYMLPTSSAQCAEHLSLTFMAELLEQLPSLSAAALLRHFPQAARDDALKLVGRRKAAGIRMLLRYPPSAVGAWMEPSVLTLPDDCTVRDASERIRRAGHAFQKVYVLDRARKVKGAVQCAALLRNDLRGPVVQLLEPIETFWARESITSAHERDFWERESAAPVVNRQDEFVGIVSYSDLRKVYRQLIQGNPVDDKTHEAGELVELFVNGLEEAWRTIGDIVRSQKDGDTGGSG
jgi:magnesium transporter